MKNIGWFWLAFSILIFSITAPVTAPVMAPVMAPMMALAVENPDRQSPLNNQRIITGTIDKISNSKISVKTDEGKTRIFTIDPSEQSDYVNRGLRKGDRIRLSYNHQNQIIGIDKVNETGDGKRNPGLHKPNPQ